MPLAPRPARPVAGGEGVGSLLMLVLAP